MVMQTDRKCKVNAKENLRGRDLREQDLYSKNAYSNSKLTDDRK